MEIKNELLEDYLAQLNLEGEQDTWEQNRVKLDLVLKKMKKYLIPAGHVCDIGIGEGYMLAQYYAMGKKVTGIDIAQFSINYLDKKFKEQNMAIELINSDISKYTPRENCFDIISCFDILEHTLPDGLDPAIESIKKMLVNGGYLIGTLPLGEDLDDSKVICPKCSHHFHRYGHFHSFASVEKIQEALTPQLKIITYSEIPYTWFKSNLLNRMLTFILKFVKQISQRKFDTTVFFVAQLNK